MGVGQLSESDAVDALRLPFYSSSHPTGSHGWRNQFDLGNPEFNPALMIGSANRGFTDTAECGRVRNGYRFDHCCRTFFEVRYMRISVTHV